MVRTLFLPLLFVFTVRCLAELPLLTRSALGCDLLLLPALGTASCALVGWSLCGVFTIICKGVRFLETPELAGPATVLAYGPHLRL